MSRNITKRSRTIAEWKKAPKAELAAEYERLRHENGDLRQRLRAGENPAGDERPVRPIGSRRVALSERDLVAIWRGMRPGSARDVVTTALDRDAPGWRARIGEEACCDG
jgi:hypothetical protein